MMGLAFSLSLSIVKCSIYHFDTICCVSPREWSNEIANTTVDCIDSPDVHHWDTESHFDFSLNANEERKKI